VSGHRGFRWLFGRVGLYSLVGLFLAYTLLPVLWMVLSSILVETDFIRLSADLILPHRIQLGYYQALLMPWATGQIEFGVTAEYGYFLLDALRATTVVASLVAAGAVILGSLAAYAFARLRFPGRDLLFIVLMSAMMVPLFVTIIPVFALVRSLNLADSHAALILPALVTPFGVFLLRQFFLTIPVELEEAARIDGANPLQIFLRVILPLGAPGLSVLAILSFNAHWNEFFRPLIFLNSWENFTVPLGLVTLRGYMGTGSVSVVTAGVVIALIPVVILFILAQRYLIEGIALTGIKG
jgi:ABC-type glycerol-3-phosphate transport system permease component